MKDITWRRWYVNLINALPNSYRSGTMPWVLFVGLVLSVSSLSIGFRERHPLISACWFVYAGVLIMLLTGVAHGLSFKLALQLSMFAALLVQLIGAWVMGGILSPPLAWLILMPLTVFFLLGRHHGRQWLFIIILFYVVLAALNISGRIKFNLDISVVSSSMSWASLALIMCIVLIVPMSYHRMYERSLLKEKQHRDELERQHAELDRMQDLRDQFIASVSHELRTPMNAILGLNESLISKISSDCEAMAVLLHMRQSGKHLMTVINDVLDYSQLQSGALPLNLEVQNLHACARSAFDMLAIKARDKGLTYSCHIQVSVPVWAQLDHQRLVQVLVNLLGNAIKFTPHGEVNLTLCSYGDRVRFEVRDTGIGITEHQRLKLFRRFAQADGSIQQRYGGNGLGLAISQRLVELMGGFLDFHSTLGKGSNFFFELDVPEQPAPVSTADIAPAPMITTDRAWCFLVVDDHPVNRLVVKRVLALNWPKANLLEVSDGLEALDAMQASPVDAVLMDMRMPIMDGIDATAAIRCLPGPGSRVVIIGLTANVNQDDLVRFRAAGLDGLMLKPFDGRDLCAHLEALLIQREREITESTRIY